MAGVVLNVDDCSDDLMLAQYACADAAVSFDLRSVDSGDKAIAYLQGSNEYSDREQFPLPDLVLLDLTMPGKSGFEVLAWIRSHEPVNKIPVIIFTGSVHAKDRLQAMELGADQFWVKPANYELLEQLMRRIDRQLNSGKAMDWINNDGAFGASGRRP